MIQPIEYIERKIACVMHEAVAADAMLIVAVSGGADSTALLTALCRLGYGDNIMGAHCNFGLRGEESDRDEQAVRRLCNSLGVRLEVLTCDVPGWMAVHGGSVEMACREIRYRWFDTLMDNNDNSLLLVAHNADDRVETVLFNLFRGTGLAGLRSIRCLRDGRVLRPLLNVRREEIERYLNSLGVDYVTDSSNLDTVFARNKIRLEILPVIDRCFSNARTGILTTADNMAATELLYQRLVDSCFVRHTVEDGVKLSDIVSELGRDAAVTALYERFKEDGMSVSVARNIISNISAGGTTRYQTGQKRYSLCNGLLTETTVNSSVTDDSTLMSLFDIKLSDRVDSGFDTYRIRGTAYFDETLLSHSLSVRFWRDGDRFRPFGMRGSKLLSDLFTDCHVPRDKRSGIPLLLADDVIVTVGSLRQSAYFPVTEKTKRIVTVSCRVL